MHSKLLSEMGKSNPDFQIIKKIILEGVTSRSWFTSNHKPAGIFRADEKGNNLFHLAAKKKLLSSTLKLFDNISEAFQREGKDYQEGKSEYFFYRFLMSKDEDQNSPFILALKNGEEINYSDILNKISSYEAKWADEVASELVIDFYSNMDQVLVNKTSASDNGEVKTKLQLINSEEFKFLQNSATSIFLSDNWTSYVGYLGDYLKPGIVSALGKVSSILNYENEYWSLNKYQISQITQYNGAMGVEFENHLKNHLFSKVISYYYTENSESFTLQVLFPGLEFPDIYKEISIQQSLGDAEPGQKFDWDKIEIRIAELFLRGNCKDGAAPHANPKAAIMVEEEAASALQDSEALSVSSSSEEKGGAFKQDLHASKQALLDTTNSNSKEGSANQKTVAQSQIAVPVALESASSISAKARNKRPSDMKMSDRSVKGGAHVANPVKKTSSKKHDIETATDLALVIKSAYVRKYQKYTTSSSTRVGMVKKVIKDLGTIDPTNVAFFIMALDSSIKATDTNHDLKGVVFPLYLEQRVNQEKLSITDYQGFVQKLLEESGEITETIKGHEISLIDMAASYGLADWAVMHLKAGFEREFYSTNDHSLLNSSIKIGSNNVFDALLEVFIEEIKSKCSEEELEGKIKDFWWNILSLGRKYANLHIVDKYIESDCGVLDLAGKSVDRNNHGKYTLLNYCLKDIYENFAYFKGIIELYNKLSQEEGGSNVVPFLKEWFKERVGKEPQNTKEVLNLASHSLSISLKKVSILSKFSIKLLESGKLYMPSLEEGEQDKPEYQSKKERILKTIKSLKNIKSLISEFGGFEEGNSEIHKALLKAISDAKEFEFVLALKYSKEFSLDSIYKQKFLGIIPSEKLETLSEEELGINPEELAKLHLDSDAMSVMTSCSDTSAMSYINYGITQDSVAKLLKEAFNSDRPQDGDGESLLGQEAPITTDGDL